MTEGEALPGTAAEQKGWRTLGAVMGVIGEGMLTLGILVGLFVVWEVWWTDVTGAHRQAAIIENLDWGLPMIPLLTTPAVTPSGGSSGDVFVLPVISVDQMEFTKDPPVEEIPGQTETFAAMYVPRWGDDYVRPISEGIGRRTVLDTRGIGHYPGTAPPGGWGNFAVAGHRTTFGKPFDLIEELVPGDAIIIRTESTWYVYRVTETHIVWPSYSAAIAAVPGDGEAVANDRYITLTTCHPRFSASKRYVVYGVLEYWAPTDAGYPPEIVPGIGEASEGKATAMEGVTS